MDSIWIITREYAGIAESGGLKNVSKGLAKEFADLNIDTSVFIPLYGCTKDYKTIKKNQSIYSTGIVVGEKLFSVNFYQKQKKKINFIFVNAKIFSEKKNIYTYTKDEADNFSKNNFKVKKGDGYIDSNYMNILFQKAVLEFAKFKKNAPEILHCQDAQTAILPALIFNDLQSASLFKNTKCFVTIHNAGNSYRQLLQYDEAKKLTNLEDKILQLATINGYVESFLLGAIYANLTTVSPWYAEELKNKNIPEDSNSFSREFSLALIKRNIHITGITNGISYASYDPSNTEKSLLPYPFELSKENIRGKYLCRDFFVKKFCNKTQNNLSGKIENIDFIGSLDIQKNKKYLYLFYHGRLTSQKGISILCKTIPNILTEYKNVRFILAGQGSEILENLCSEIANNNFGLCLFIKGYNKPLVRLATAISDFIILPSLFEPCGMEDLIAQIYGCIPIANAIGGLNKIEDNKTGFLYHFDINDKNSNEKNHIEKLTGTILRQCKLFFESAHILLLEDDYYFNIAKNANKKLLTEFSWKKIINQYLKLFTKI